MTFAPLISTTACVTLAITLLILLAVFAARRPVGVSWRRWSVIVSLTLLGAVLVLLMIMNPVASETMPPPAGRPLLTVLFDRSASMATPDAEHGVTRSRAAALELEKFITDLGDRFDLRIRTFADTASEATPESLQALSPDGDSSDLAAALETALDAERLSGHAVLLISDGAHNGPGGIVPVLDAVHSARALQVPVYTRTVGGTGSQQDLSLSLTQPQELAFVNQRVPVRVRVRQQGRLADQVEVSVSRDGEPVTTATVKVAPDDTADAILELESGDVGITRYEVAIRDVPGEAAIANNATPFLLRTIDHPVRVLVIEGKPYWDSKFLIRTLSADSVLDLDSLVRVTPSRLWMRTVRRADEAAESADSGDTDSESSLAIPSSTDDSTATESQSAPRMEKVEMLQSPAAVLGDRKSLARYQVIVIGRDAEVFFDQQTLEALRQWVARDGGSLVCFRGNPATSSNAQLDRLLPVRWSGSQEHRFRVQLTEQGADVSWLGSASDVIPHLPSLSTQSRVQNVRPLAIPLARAQDDPNASVVTYQPYGTGKAVVVEGSGMWRWAFLAPEFQQHDDVYRTLWQSLIRWLISTVGLVPGQDVMLRMDQVVHTEGEPIHAWLLMRSEAAGRQLPVLHLTCLDDQSSDVFTPVPVGDEPGVYRVSLGTPPAGRYRAAIDSAADPRSLSGLSETERKSADSLRTIDFEVRPAWREALETNARPDLMARIADDTGGAALTEYSADELVERFHQQSQSNLPSRSRQIPLWDRWWTLAGILMVWAALWSLRRMSGLV